MHRLQLADLQIDTPGYQHRKTTYPLLLTASVETHWVNLYRARINTLIERINVESLNENPITERGQAVILRNQGRVSELEKMLDIKRFVMEGLEEAVKCQG